MVLQESAPEPGLSSGSAWPCTPGSIACRKRDSSCISEEVRDGQLVQDGEPRSAIRSIASSDTGDKLVPKSDTELELIKGTDS